MPVAKAPTIRAGIIDNVEIMRPKLDTARAICVVRTAPYRSITDPAIDVKLMAPVKTMAEYKPTLLASISISLEICGVKTGIVIIAIATAI
tara:strand:- start:4479 stop:4751 length:273 start_codon:yes stop_codon:yes gene_type:complete